MELAYLPNQGLTEKRYKHFTVNANFTADTNTTKKNEFFYVGRNTAVIDSLVDLFEGGYAAENVDKAISILKRIVEKRGSCPDVILVDSNAGLVAFNRLQSFLTANKQLATVPFLAEATDGQESELSMIRSLSYVDEIVYMSRGINSRIMAKIAYIKKIKDSQNKKQLQQNVGYDMVNTRTKGFIAKRAFDILVTSVILLLASPLFLLIAIAIRLESKGPIFYIAKRAGRGYRIFNFFKFRTMEVGADKKVEQLSHLNQYNANKEEGPVFFKVSNDPRITKVGCFLRNSSLDELPQLINVLLGDMSLVGNRPLPLYEAETLTTDRWAERFMAPAGITGLWQIKKRGQDDMSVEERIGLDIVYANRNSFMYDLWIMTQTPTALIQKSNV